MGAPAGRRLSRARVQRESTPKIGTDARGPIAYAVEVKEQPLSRAPDGDASSLDLTAEVHVAARPSERQCPLCWEPARVLGNVGCPECRARFHRECADELQGRCATLGCPGTLPTSPPPRPYLEHFQGPPRRSQGRARRAWRRAWRRRLGLARDRVGPGHVWVAIGWVVTLVLIAVLATQLGPFDPRVVITAGISLWVGFVGAANVLRDAE